jgi:hypothetical protein
MRMMILSDGDRKEFIRRISEFPVDGKKRFTAEWKIHRKVRSLAQARLYFMWLKCISQDTGTSVDDLHEFMKNKFLPWDTTTIFGEEVQRYRTTTQLNTKEFTDYLEQIRQFSLEQSIYLPQPGEQAWDSFYQEYGQK